MYLATFRIQRHDPGVSRHASGWHERQRSCFRRPHAPLHDASLEVIAEWGRVSSRLASRIDHKIVGACLERTVNDLRAALQVGDEPGLVNHEHGRRGPNTGYFGLEPRGLMTCICLWIQAHLRCQIVELIVHAITARMNPAGDGVLSLIQLHLVATPHSQEPEDVAPGQTRAGDSNSHA